MVLSSLSAKVICLSTVFSDNLRPSDIERFVPPPFSYQPPPYVVSAMISRHHQAFSYALSEAVPPPRKAKSRLRLWTLPPEQMTSCPEENPWTELGRITENMSGFPRNHNPGFLTDTKGYLPSDEKLVVFFTPAVTGGDWLWSYDLYSATFNLKKDKR